MPVKNLSHAKKIISRLRGKENKLQHTQKMLIKTTYDMGERVKELNCLYCISSIVENQSNSLNDIIQGAVMIIPDAWQYPDITCSRIVLEDRVFQTPNYRETVWKQTRHIVVRGNVIGFLQICYLHKRPNKYEGPFLREERKLINVLAERMGEIIERKEAQEALRESQAHNSALLDAIPDLMFQLDTSGTILGFHEGKFTELLDLLEELVGRNVFILSDEKGLLPRRLLEQVMVHAKLAFATRKAQVFERHITLNGTGRDFEVRLVIIKDNEVLGMIRDITFRKRLEKEIIEISGREQRRIGQDLHDSLCQQLAGIGFLCKAIENKLNAGRKVRTSEATEVVRYLDEAITLTRGFARGLNPVRLEAKGLMLALSELALTTEKLFGISCRFEYNQPLPITDNTAAIHLYRIVQEALNNAIKHGNAKKIIITLDTRGDLHTLAVKDNGSGLSSGAHHGKGMGLNIMHYRASMIGALMDIRNHDDGGVVVVCTFLEKKDN